MSDPALPLASPLLALAGLVTFALLAPLAAWAGGSPTVAWVAEYDGSAASGDQAIEALPAPDGGIYTVATVIEVDDGPPPVAAPRILIARYDADGALLWDRTVDQGLSAIAIDAAIDDAGNVFALGVIGFSEIVLAKVSPAGSVLWTRTRSGDPSLDSLVATGVAVDPAGDVYALGAEFNSSVSQGLVAKYQADGTLEWALEDDTLLNLGPAAGVANADDLFFAGVDSSAEEADFLVGRILGDGTLDWTTSLGDDAEDTAIDVALDGTGAVIACGTYTTETQGTDLAVVKLASSDGMVVWERTVDTTALDDESFALAIDPNDRVAVAGIAQTGPQEGAGLLVVHDADGSLQWSRTLDDLSGSLFHSVTASAGGLFFVAGEGAPGSQAVLAAARYRADGTRDWLYTKPADPDDSSRGRSITQDTSGRAVVAGSAPSSENDSIDAVTVAFDHSVFADGFESGDTTAWSDV